MTRVHATCLRCAFVITGVGADTDQAVERLAINLVSHRRGRRCAYRARERDFWIGNSMRLQEWWIEYETLHQWRLDERARLTAARVEDSHSS